MQRKKPPLPVAPPRDLRPLYLVALLLLLTLAAYSNSFSTGFALDNHLILEDARIQSPTAANIDLILSHTYWWPNGESGLYRPFTTLSYLLNYAILGNADHPAGYHWINFFLHAANVCLVFALASRFSPRIAFFIALLWAVHPVLTESVTNIVGRADLLAALAVLSGFLFYLKSAESTGWRHSAYLVALALATLIGVFSKESAVILPAVIILYELTLGNRWRKLFPALIATLVPIALMLWQRALVLSSSLPAEYPFLDNPIAGAAFWTGRLTALTVLGRYLWLALWPLNLSADYSYPQIPLATGTPEDWLGWLSVACALALTAILWNRSRPAFFFAAFAFLNLLPASNLLFPIGTVMAERLLYLPLVGILAAAIITLHSARLPHSAVAISLVMIAALLAVRTWLRNPVWTDDQTMALAGVRSSPLSYKFHRLLAAQLLTTNPSPRNLDQAVAEADRSVAILAPVPDALSSPVPWNLAAVCHRKKGDTLPHDAARAQYEETVRLALRSIAIEQAVRMAYDRRYGIETPVPTRAGDGYRTLAFAYLHLDRAPEALAAATTAQKIDPANSAVYEEIADAQLARSHGEDAAIALAEALFAAGNQHLLDELLKLYQSGVDAQHCAVKPGPHGPTLNPACPIVHRDLCEATLRLNRPDLRGRLACADY